MRQDEGKGEEEDTGGEEMLLQYMKIRDRMVQYE